jgi:hypothetical protein
MTTLSDRIAGVYQRHTGAASPHGSQTWFAGQCGVQVRAVQRWIAGDRQPGGPVLALLERLEKDRPRKRNP